MKWEFDSAGYRMAKYMQTPQGKMTYFLASKERKQQMIDIGLGRHLKRK